MKSFNAKSLDVFELGIFLNEPSDVSELQGSIAGADDGSMI